VGPRSSDAAAKEALQHRANLALDVVNSATSPGGEVVLYVDVSIDGGTSYTNRAKNAHLINSTTIGVEHRQVQVWLPLILGSALGISDATPPANIKLRGSGRTRCSGRAVWR